jgi:hypothetical protein
MLIYALVPQRVNSVQPSAHGRGFFSGKPFLDRELTFVMGKVVSVSTHFKNSVTYFGTSFLVEAWVLSTVT